MALELCLYPQAKRPYYIETINTEIWSIEELCYYLYQNIYLVDETICNELLCNWIRDELGMQKLYRVLYDILDRDRGMADFVLAIFRETGYLGAEQMRLFQDEFRRMAILTEEARKKRKGDYLVQREMYFDAVNVYVDILRGEEQDRLSPSFYAAIWSNLGCAKTRLFAWQEAAECFYHAYELVHTKESLRKYVSVLPFYMDREQYDQALEKLACDPEVIAGIEEYNAHLTENVFRQIPEHTDRQEMIAALEEYAAAYRKSMRSQM